MMYGSSKRPAQTYPGTGRESVLAASGCEPQLKALGKPKAVYHPVSPEGTLPPLLQEGTRSRIRLFCAPGNEVLRR